MTAVPTLCKHAWLDQVALHATPRTPKAFRLEEGELAFAVHLKSIIRGDVVVVTADAMAERTGIPHRTVRRYFRAFKAWRFIAVEWSSGGSKGHSIKLLDAEKAAVDRNWSKDETRPSKSGRVDGDEKQADESSNPATHECPGNPATLRGRTEADVDVRGDGPSRPRPQSTVESTIGDSSLNEAPDVAAPDAPEGAGASVAEDPPANEAIATTVLVDAMESVSSTVVPYDSSFEERVAALDTELGDLRDSDTGLYSADLPRVILAFIDRDDDPSEAELCDLESAFGRWMTGDWVEPATLDEQLAEHDRRARLYGRGADRDDGEAVADQPLAPLSERIGDEALRASFIGRMVERLVPLEREQRWHLCRLRQAQIVAELKANLPRFKAEILGQALLDDVQTELWRRTRDVELGALGAAPPIPNAETGSAAHA